MPIAVDPSCIFKKKSFKLSIDRFDRQNRENLNDQLVGLQTFSQSVRQTDRLTDRINLSTPKSK